VNNGIGSLFFHGQLLYFCSFETSVGAETPYGYSCLTSRLYAASKHYDLLVDFKPSSLACVYIVNGWLSTIVLNIDKLSGFQPFRIVDI
jgi:hypothetical protein